MANHKSSEKRARQDIKKTAVNKMAESRAKTAIKKVRDAITSGDKSVATTLLVTAQSELSKLAKKGVIKLGAAARKTSRLALQINNLK